jgi:hypothetical protein
VALARGFWIPCIRDLYVTMAARARDSQTRFLRELVIENVEQDVEFDEDENVGG